MNGFDISRKDARGKNGTKVSSLLFFSFLYFCKTSRGKDNNERERMGEFTVCFRRGTNLIVIHLCVE